MKKIIVCGSLLVVVILMMLPMVSATEANTVKTTIAQPFRLHIPEIDMDILQEKNIDNDPSPQTIILLTLAILLLKLLRSGLIIIVGTIGLIFYIIYRILNRDKNLTALPF